MEGTWLGQAFGLFNFWNVLFVSASGSRNLLSDKCHIDGSSIYLILSTLRLWQNSTSPTSFVIQPLFPFCGVLKGSRSQKPGFDWIFVDPEHKQVSSPPSAKVCPQKPWIYGQGSQKSKLCTDTLILNAVSSENMWETSSGPVSGNWDAPGSQVLCVTPWERTVWTRFAT